MSEEIYLFEYEHNGSRWTVEMPASDLDDARARLRKLPHATYLGVLHAKIPASLGWFARAWVVIANFFRNK